MNCPFCLERHTRRGVANGTMYIVPAAQRHSRRAVANVFFLAAAHSRLRQAERRTACHWRLPHESVFSGKVFLRGEAQKQAASSTHSDFPTTLGTLQPFVRKLACPSRYTARLCPFNASSACHNLTTLCYTLWCVEPVI